MKIFEIILIGLSLSIDAFGISVCKGLSINKHKIGITMSLSFAFFQFIMPVLGFYLGNIISNKIINYHTYFSSILLIIIGILMIKEDKITLENNKLNYLELFFLSIATSIDAFVIGLSFSFLKTDIFYASSIIGIITLVMCLIGYFLGHLFNKKAHQYSNLIGGITLIILGIKYLFN